jgi:hypothetical protein
MAIVTTIEIRARQPHDIGMHAASFQWACGVQSCGDERARSHGAAMAVNSAEVHCRTLSQTREQQETAQKHQAEAPRVSIRRRAMRPGQQGMETPADRRSEPNASLTQSSQDANGRQNHSVKRFPHERRLRAFPSQRSVSTSSYSSRINAHPATATPNPKSTGADLASSCRLAPIDSVKCDGRRRQQRLGLKEAVVSDAAALDAKSRRRWRH